MYQNLEDRLKLYEQDHPIKDDDGLISAIDVILNEQESLPVEERDFDLIAEATDSILKLQGYRESDLATMAEEAAALVRTRIARQKGVTSDGKPQNKHRSVLRWIIPLVAIIIATTLAVFASPINRLAISDMTKRVFSSIIPKQVYYEGDIELKITDDNKSYTSLLDLASNFDGSILLPYDLEKECQNLHITVLNFDQTSSINIRFEYCNTPCSIIIMNKDKDADTNIIYNARIGQFDVFLVYIDKQFLASWTHGEYYYQVSSASQEQLDSIIENMR